ncbi:hypothetical protein DL96DRAFT_892122 [Flagelloscypha sp. PMI_526]|nr:hypothetical protein DL96DRAFT_892122 [Flagelloscypha sp. PMI_526]
MYGGPPNAMLNQDERYSQHIHPGAAAGATGGSAAPGSHKRPRLDDDVNDPNQRPYPQFYSMPPPPPMPGYGGQPPLPHFSGSPRSGPHPGLPPPPAHHHSGYPPPPPPGLYNPPSQGSESREYRLSSPSGHPSSSGTPRSGSPLLPQWSTLPSDGGGGSGGGSNGPSNKGPSTIGGGPKNGRLADLMSPEVPPAASMMKRSNSNPSSPVDDKGSD